MRIRKNSAFLIANSNLSSSHRRHHHHEINELCQLNQSPWDITNFSPTPIPQFDRYDSHYNVNLSENWSSVGAIESVVASTKNSFEYEYDNKLYEKANNQDMVLCGNTNGNVVKNDNLDDDLQSDAVWSTNNNPRPVSRSIMRPKRSKPRSTKKRAVAITSNTNEFYYYSGFGPSWGKKRGMVSGNKGTTVDACGTITSNSSNVGVEDEGRWIKSDTTRTRTSWSCEVGPENKDLDYMNVEREDEKEKVVKKRGRKPIKARSLKSLM